MNAEKWVNLRVYESTRERVFLAKKNTSVDDLLSSMLRYFEHTGYDPLAFHKNPTLDFAQDLKKETERIIKIVRAIEKDYLKPIKEMVSDTSKLDAAFESAMYIENSQLSVEELNTLVEENKRKEEAIEQLNLDLEKTRKERDLLKVSKPENAEEAINKEVILQCLDMIKQEAKKNRMQEGTRIIEEVSLNQYIQRIQKELQKK